MFHYNIQERWVWEGENISVTLFPSHNFISFFSFYEINVLLKYFKLSLVKMAMPSLHIPQTRQKTLDYRYKFWSFYTVFKNITQNEIIMIIFANMFSARPFFFSRSHSLWLHQGQAFTQCLQFIFLLYSSPPFPFSQISSVFLMLVLISLI